MEKCTKVTPKTINLKYQVQCGTKDLNYFILYQIYRSILSISS